MADVANPSAVVEDPKVTPEPEPQPEPTPEPEPEPSPEPEPEPTGPSAEELQKQIEEKDAEIERLKGETAKKEPEPPIVERRAQNLVTDHFIKNILPEARKSFTSEDATPEKQFNTIIDTVNQMIGAVQTDQIRPQIEGLATALIETLNELEIRDLRGEVSEFKKTFEKQVRETLSKANWKDRGNMDFVRGIYHRILGASSDGKKAVTVSKPAIPAASGALKDISAGKGGQPTRPSTVRLTPQQETDRKSLEEETGTPYPAELYQSKLKARQDKAKAAGKRIPSTLTELV